MSDGPSNDYVFWRDSAEDVVLHEQPLTAVYLNDCNHVVIRQQCDVYEDDPFVTIAPENLEAVIDAMRKQAELARAAREEKQGRRKALPPPSQKPPDPSKSDAAGTLFQAPGNECTA